jgi:DNA-binding Lrp family transcriptional regulator
MLAPLGRAIVPRTDRGSNRRSHPATELQAAAMLETAYVLVKLDRSTPAEVARQVRRIPGIIEAAVTMGDVDVLAVARDESTKALADIGHAVGKLDGVAKVSLCIVVRP